MIRWLRRLLGLERRPAPVRRDRYEPGTVVWGPVAYADGSGAKDRPVLVVGRSEPGVLLVLTLSSQAKRDGRREWHPIGTGPWDRQGRPSWARLDPYYRMQEKEVRRVGGSVDREVLRAVGAALTARHGTPPRGLWPGRL